MERSTVVVQRLPYRVTRVQDGILVYHRYEAVLQEPKFAVLDLVNKVPVCFCDSAESASYFVRIWQAAGVSAAVVPWPSE